MSKAEIAKDRLYVLSEEMRQALEMLRIPMAMFQLLEDKIYVLLVSDGLLGLQAPDCTREEMCNQLQHDMYRNVHSDDAVHIAVAMMEFAHEKDNSYDVIYREKLYGKDTYSMVHAKGYHRCLEDGGEYIVVYYDDITGAMDDNKAQDSLYEHAVEDVINSTGEALAVVAAEKNHQMLVCNQEMRSLWPPVRAIDSGITFAEYLYPADSTPPFELDQLADGPETMVTIPNSDKEILLRVIRMYWKGQPAYLLRGTLWDNKYYDSLTKLPNSNYFQERGNVMAARILENGRKPCVLDIKIRRMVPEDSRYDSSSDDDLLLRIAAHIRLQFGDDLVCRFSDDLFVVMTDDKTVEKDFGSVHQQIMAQKKGEVLRVYAGACAIDGDASSFMVAEDRARLAEIFLQGNPDTDFIRYEAYMEQEAELYDFVASHIDAAVSEQHIQIFYQPIVRTLTKSLCGFEALARWQDPHRGTLEPARFVGTLENVHQIHKLDIYIIRTVCRDIRACLDNGGSMVPVSVNLSKLDFMVCDIFEIVEQTVMEFQIPREFLHIEVTEKLLSGDDTVPLELARFKAAGYEIWMDDFGRAHSSLQTIREYDFNALKIDMSFQADLGERDRNIIRYTVAMAKNIGLDTVAERVETEEQFRFLMEIGCEKIQGYYFGRPMPLAAAMDNVRMREILLESPADKAVFRSLSRTDFQLEDGVVIFSFQQARLRYLGCNSQFLKLLHLLGIADLKALEKMMNSGSMGRLKRIYNDARIARKQNRTVTFHFMMQGTLCFWRIEYLGECGSVQYYRMRAHKAVGNFPDTQRSAFHPSLQYLFELFQDVAAVDVEQDKFEKIYAGPYWAGYNGEMSFQAFSDSFSKQAIHPEDASRFEQMMNRNWLEEMAKHNNRYLKEFFRICGPDGEMQWVALNILATESNTQFLFCVQEMPQEVLADYFNYAYAQNQTAAYHETDEFTHLLNRTGLDRYIGEYLEQAVDEPAVLLAVDIDNMQFINDRYGYLVGDAVIRQVANNLRQWFGKSGFVGRNASDEFLVLLRNMDLSLSEPLVKECCACTHNIVFEEQEIRVTLTMGVAEFPVHGKNLPTLSRKADAALYHAKMRGRNGYAVFSADMNSMQRTIEGIHADNVAQELPGALIVYRVSGTGEILYGNQGLVNLFECRDMKDFLTFSKGNFRNLLYPEDREAVEASSWNQLMHQKDSKLDFASFRIVTKQGKIRCVQKIGKLVCSPEYGELFYVFLYDDDQRRSLLEHQTMLYDSGVAATLSQEFLTVYSLCLPAEKFHVVKVAEPHKKKYAELFEEKNYREIVRKFIRIGVKEQDHKLVEQALSPEYMVEQLSQTEYYSQLYRNLDGVYYEIKVVREGKALHPMQIIIGFAECDERTRMDLHNRQIIQGLTEEYGLIFEVQLANDTIERCIHRSDDIPPHYADNLLRGASYSYGFETFLRYDVSEESREILEKQMSVAALRKQLGHQRSVSCKVMAGNGRYYEWRAVRLSDDNREVSHVLVAMADKDKEIRTEQAKAVELQHNIDMISGLAEEYAALYLLDLHTGQMIPYRKEIHHIDEAFPVSRGYQQAMHYFVDNHVYEPDKQRVMADSDLRQVRAALSQEKSYSIIFSVWQEERLTFREIKFVRVEGEGRHVVLGFLDRDDDIRLRYVNEQLVKEYSAIYICELDLGRIRGFLPSHYVKHDLLDSEDYATVMRALGRLVASAYQQLWQELCNPQHVQQLLQKDNRREFIYEVPGIDNTWRRLILQVVGRMPDGKVTRIIMSFMAIDFKQAEQLALNRQVKQQKKKLETQHDQLALALKQANSASKAKTDFLSNMSHDIRTPMNAIIGFTELAETHKDNPELVQGYLDKISTASHHLLSLINDVLDMSRIESGKVTLEEKEADLQEMVAGIQDILQNDMRQKGLEFVVDIDGVRNRMVICDKLRINQILLNCLSNAMKFTPDGGRAGLRIVQLDNAPAGYGNFSFEVWDTGIGMSDEYAKHIFEPFTRERTSTVSKIQGTGLGMAIVKNIVDMMNGSVTVYSERGKGTTFHIELMLRLAEEAIENKPGKKKVQLPQAGHFVGKTILIVEDNEINLEIVLALLGDYGAELVPAENGSVAVDAYAKEPLRYDLILMDIQMPCMDGMEATKRIRQLEEKGHHVPIIAMTANAFAEDRRAAMDSGMDDYITKPVDVPVLLGKLQEYLG